MLIFVAEDGESGPGGCVGKTPVSLLQELYVRRGMVPKVMNELVFSAWIRIQDGIPSVELDKKIYRPFGIYMAREFSYLKS